VLAKKSIKLVNRPPIYKVFIVQMLFTLSISLVLLFISGYVAAYSSLIGGTIFAIPQLYFGFKAFLYAGAHAVQNVVINFYKGESTKILLIAVSFALVFKFLKPVDYFALYSTFISVLILNCFSLYLFKGFK
jgi:ATP synthase protein I